MNNWGNSSRHDNIIDLMKLLRYPTDRGLCFGIMSMARQAIFVGDLKTFDARIKRIEALYDLDQSTTIEERFDSLERVARMDLHAFFDGVALYQKLLVSTEVLPKKYNQLARDAAQFVMPTVLANDPPIIARSDCFVFKRHEDHFKRWLDSLKEKLQSEFAIELLSSNHAIVVSYDQRENHWVFIDANALPSQRFAETQALRETIHKAFDPSSASENLLLNAALFTKQSHSEAMTAQLSETDWERMKQESIQRAREKDAFGANLFYFAASVGDVQLATHLINSEDLNCIYQKIKRGLTPLGQVVKCTHLEMVKLFIENGVNPNSVEHDGATPLYIAAHVGHLEIVQYLIGKGAEVNTARHDGKTPLYIAAYFGHLEIVQYLIEKGAEVNAARHNGVTPLYVAVYFNYLEVAQCLIENGAEVNAARHNGVTPFWVARRLGHSKIVALLERAQKRPDDGAMAVDDDPQASSLGTNQFFRVKKRTASEANDEKNIDLTGEPNVKKRH